MELGPQLKASHSAMLGTPPHPDPDAVGQVVSPHSNEGDKLTHTFFHEVRAERTFLSLRCPNLRVDFTTPVLSVGHSIPPISLE